MPYALHNSTNVKRMLKEIKGVFFFLTAPKIFNQYLCWSYFIKKWLQQISLILSQNEKIFSIKFFYDMICEFIFFYDGFTDTSFKSTFYGNYTLQRITVQSVLSETHYVKETILMSSMFVTGCKNWRGFRGNFYQKIFSDKCTMD